MGSINVEICLTGLKIGLTGVKMGLSVGKIGLTVSKRVKLGQMYVYLG